MWGGMKQSAAELFAPLEAFMAAGCSQSCVLVCPSFAVLAKDVSSCSKRLSRNTFDMVSSALLEVQLSSEGWKKQLLVINYYCLSSSAGHFLHTLNL